MKLKLVIFCATILVIVCLMAALVWTHELHQRELTRLRNEVANRDSTIEVQKGVFSRRSLEIGDLKTALDSKDTQIVGLLAEIKKGHEALLTANQLALKWREAYQAVGKGTQVEVIGEGASRKRVDFAKGFGTIAVSGWTLTDPPEYSLKVEQTKPLILTLALSQDTTGAWHSYVTSDDSNTIADIKVSAVSPYVLEPRWYQRLRLHGFVAGGLNEPGFGIIAGGGVSYELGRYEIGPMVFVTATDRLDRYLGLTVAWRMF